MGSRIREVRKEVGFEEGDLARETKDRSIVLGYNQSGRGNVGRINLSGRKFFGQSHGDTARAGADIHDGEVFTGEFCRAAGADFADRQAVEGDFDEVFGFRAGDEDIGSHCKFESPEFLFASEVLRGFAGRAAADQGKIVFGCVGVEDLFRVGVKPGAMATCRLEEKEFGG